jgi:hypothetical protein
MDVYIWVPVRDAKILADFIGRYVDREESGDARLLAFMRVYVAGVPADGDREALAELQAEETDHGVFSLYVKGRGCRHAMITITREDALVLGLSIDDPESSPLVVDEARELLDRLRTEFSSPAGRAGVELVPARSREEWDDDALVEVRVGGLTEERGGPTFSVQ